MSWYEIKAMGNRRASIDIEGEIGWEVTSRRFRRELAELGTLDQIDVTLNSPGGSVFEGIAIYNTLKDHDAQVDVYVNGLAASMGSVIMQAGDTVRIADTGSVMIHNPANIVWGTADQMRKEADNLDKHKKTLMTAYQARGKLSLTDKQLSEAMNEESWYTADEARAVGLVDEVVENEDTAAAHFDLTKYRNAPAELCARFKNLSNSSSSAAQPEGHAMKKYDQAELDAAVTAASDAARVEATTANATAIETAVATAEAAVHARYETLMNHANASNTAAVARIAKSGISLEDAEAMMGDVAPKAAVTQETPEPVDYTAIANKAAVDAVAAMRAQTSDTTNVDLSNVDGGQLTDAQAQQAAIDAANKRRGAK